MIDVLYLAYNRLEFTVQSFLALVANTNWKLVSRLIVYDDGSTDGTRELLRMLLADPWENKPEIVFRRGEYRNPVGVMIHHFQSGGADLFAKIDNDVIVPPRWLDRCLAVLEAHPELQLLGIEPPDSRRLKEAAAEEELKPGPPRYVACHSIGGIGVMRRACFWKGEMRPHSTYGGFTDWQIRHPEIPRGWIAPALRLFLLDRLPMDPWKSLSAQYIAAHWQRSWYEYPEDAARRLWAWWKPVEVPAIVRC